MSIKLTLTLNLVVSPPDEWKAHIVGLVRDLVSGEYSKLNEEPAPLGFVLAAEKVHDGTDDDTVLITAVGEVISQLLTHRLTGNFPSSFEARIQSIAYAETAKPIEPHEDTVPVVLVPRHTYSTVPPSSSLN